MSLFRKDARQTRDRQCVESNLVQRLYLSVFVLGNDRQYRKSSHLFLRLPSFVHRWHFSLGCMLNVGVPVQGCKAVICMPVTTPEIKIEAVRRLGGQVELVGETYSETQTYAQVNLVTIIPSLTFDCRHLRSCA